MNIEPVKQDFHSPYRPASQSDLAYQQLKHGLTTLAYKPGEYLNVPALMAEFGVGRTPLVQAFHRLESEGLVTIFPRKGVMVSPLSLDDALHLIEVRLVNETLCVRLAASRAVPRDLEQLEQLAAHVEAAVRTRDVARMLDYDRQFHEKITSAADNPLLSEILGVLQARSQRFWALSLSNEDHLAEVLEEHQAVLAALKQRDGEAAAVAISKHIQSFQASLLKGRAFTSAVYS